MVLTIELKLLISLLLGAVIGLERENYEKEVNHIGDYNFGALGIRTFSLITALGCVAGLLRAQYFSLFLTINITFMVLLLAYYVIGSFFIRDHGMTTELAIIISYLLGVFVALEVFSIQLILAITIILILILSKKERIKDIVTGIKTNELNAFISYAIIALVVLPFLPKQSFTLSNIPNLDLILSSYGISLGKFAFVEILNPYKLWLVVALITGVDVAGYVLEKTIGQKKGWLLTSIAGGFVSSTAVTQSLAQRSKKTKGISRLVAAAIFSNLASFFQIFILIASINSLFLVKSTLAILAIVVSAFLVGLYFLKVKEPVTEENLEKTKEKLKKTEIFALAPALKFAFIFLLIKLVTKISLTIFGSGGFMITSSIAAVAGVDAVVINLSELVGGAITFQTGVLTLILVNAVNIISKIIYSFMQGKKEFALKFMISGVIIIASSFLGLLAF